MAADTEQMALDFNRRRARADDPATSKAAAAAVKSFAGDVYLRVLVALQAGAGTSWDVAARAGLQERQAGKRMSELGAAGVIETTGETKPGPSGRACRIWRMKPMEGGR